ncbi:uncharacterized protein LOC131598016 [Vicia villosa]|uniref:uncharacterized protein LOC131598016 n=1 Tax=Vicia villosa TaxID=3911 RepID=UPI00273A90A6|nr:uncharacterized protein LOC131598016 [Vicia villosa]
MIMSWINHSVEAEIAQSILWMDNATDMWNELKDRFYQGDIFRISDLQEEICMLKQGDATISSYYTKLKILWQELDNFRPNPECSCISTCLAISKIRSYRESDKVIGFLKDLNDQYSAIRSQIMWMDLLPNLCKVYSLLVQQERQAITPIDEAKVLAISNSITYQQYQSKPNINSRGRGSTRGGRFSGGKGRGNRICTRCGMTNHTIDTCFKKHGYPPNWKQDAVVNQCADRSEEQSLTPLTTLPHILNSIKDSSKMMIGTAELHNGLYLLISPKVSLPNNPSAHHINSILSQFVDIISDCSLWHSRLGHALYAKLFELNKVFPFIKRLPFPNSSHRNQ